MYVIKERFLDSSSETGNLWTPGLPGSQRTKIVLAAYKIDNERIYVTQLP